MSLVAMSHSERALTRMAYKLGRLSCSGDRVERIETATGRQYAVVDYTGRNVRCLLGYTIDEAKAALTVPR